jgi:hypothetical protein
MERDEIDEGAAVAGETSEGDGVLDGVVYAAQHHVLERNAPLKSSRGCDHVSQRVLHVHRHQRPAEIIRRRVDGDGEPELFRTL